MILLGDLVKVLEVNTEPEISIFLLAKRTGAPPGALEA